MRFILPPTIQDKPAIGPAARQSAIELDRRDATDDQERQAVEGLIVSSSPPSALPGPLRSIAEDFPLTTIAAFGALSAVVFSLSVGMTRYALRRAGLFGARAASRNDRTWSSDPWERRLDDLERRVVDAVQANRATQAAEASALKRDLLAAAVPWVSRIEASLKERQAAEDRLAQLEQRLKSEEQMRRKIEDDIRALRSEMGLSPKLAEISSQHEPMTVGDISQAVREVQAAYRRALDQAPAAPSSLPGATTASETTVAAPDRPSTPIATEFQSLTVLQGSSLPPTESQRERLKREATAAANRAHTERTANDLHVDDGERASRAAERGGMAERMRRQAEETKRRMQELKKASWATELAERQRQEQAKGAGEAEATAQSDKPDSTSAQANTETMLPPRSADSAELVNGSAPAEELGGETEPLVELPEGVSVGASASKRSSKTKASGGKSAEVTSDKDASWASAASRSSGSPDQPVEADERSSSRPSRSSAVHGIDESGDWSFTIARPPSTDGWHDVPIILRRNRSSHRLLRGLFHSQVSSSTSETAYSTTAKVFFYPHADMVELDGAVWRCGQEGKRYVVRERISGPGGPL